ncbi:MAG: hypothetical protein GY895_14800 [Phycisphaera sp.]|nr:hypothetical protein [Phycisphaera sp.]
MGLAPLIALVTAFTILPQSAMAASGVVVADDDQQVLNKRLFDLAKTPGTTAEQLATVLAEGADPEASPKSIGVPGSAGVLYRAAVNLKDPRAIEVLLDAGLVPAPRIVRAAVRSNSSPEVVELLIDANRIAASEDPSLQVPNTWNHLLEAATWNPSPAIIRFLIASGEHDVNASGDGPLDLTPFLAASQRNPNPAVLEALIKGGARTDIEAGTRRNRLTALSLACGGNPNVEVIRFLVELGGDADAPYPDGRPPYLMAALSGRHPETFKLLVEHGADPNILQAGRDTATNIAQFNSNDGMMAAAIDAGTRPRAIGPGGSPLLGLAVQNSSIDPLAALLDRGFDPNAGDTRPLNWCAVLTKRPEMVDLLVDAGADLDHRTDSNDEMFPLLTSGSNALMAAAFNLSDRGAAVLRAFVDTGIDVDATNDAGTTALMMVASRKSDSGKQTVPMIRVLIDAGADPTLRDRAGRTAREIADANPKLQGFDLEVAFAPSVSDE